MVKKVFIVHGWEGYPEEGWFPWLKTELEKEEFSVDILQMPNPSEPKMEEWVPFLSEKSKEVNEDTYFVGHSVGCQTILRYLVDLSEDIKVGGVVLVGAWFSLTPETFEEEGIEEIARPWLDTPIDWDKVRKRK